MSTNFREFVADLRAAGQIREITKPVDIRHIAALVDQSETALMFSNVFVLSLNLPKEKNKMRNGIHDYTNLRQIWLK